MSRMTESVRKMVEPASFDFRYHWASTSPNLSNKAFNRRPLCIQLWTSTNPIIIFYENIASTMIHTCTGTVSDNKSKSDLTQTQPLASLQSFQTKVGKPFYYYVTNITPYRQTILKTIIAIYIKIHLFQWKVKLEKRRRNDAIESISTKRY